MILARRCLCLVSAENVASTVERSAGGPAQDFDLRLRAEKTAARQWKCRPTRTLIAKGAFPLPDWDAPRAVPSLLTKFARARCQQYVLYVYSPSRLLHVW